MHVIISTHRLGDLPAVVESILRSHIRPQTLTVGCDAIRKDVACYLGDAANRAPFPIVLAQRPFKGGARRGQNRNNAVRAIRDCVKSGDMLYFLDGDVCPDWRHLEAVDQALAADVIIGRVVRLSESASIVYRNRLHEQRPFRLPFCQRLGFIKKVWKAKTACGLRTFTPRLLGSWIPPYWPDLRSGNVAIRADLYYKVNGFDEFRTDWGTEDNDLGLRLYRAGSRVATFSFRCLAFHLWHPSGVVSSTPKRVRESLEKPGFYAAFGLESAYDQADSEIRVTRFASRPEQPKVPDL
jgi:hypothetical protein